MIPRSKQPNDFDSFSDADDASEEWSSDTSFSADAEGATPSLAWSQREGTGGGAPVTEGGRKSPADFSADELALARDLQALFPLDQEQLPPFYIQTLTQAERAVRTPTGLDQRVTYRVFRRLSLPRRLFGGAGVPPLEPPRGVTRLGHAPRTVALSLVLALTLLSLITVAPSFAQGVRMLLGQTGVQFVPHYPHPTLAPPEQVQYLSLRETREAVPFPVYWLGLNPGSYQYQELVLHIGQPWAEGPVVELQYSHADPSIGYGRLIVREFRPAAGATVLQVVAAGAAHPTQVGDQPAIFIDGHWVQQRQGIVWQYGTQAELLYQAYGLVFWITADQRDGATMALLGQWAQALDRLYLGQPRSHLPDLSQPAHAQLAAALSSAELGEVVALLPAGVSPETGSAVYIAEGAPPDDN